MSTDTVKTDPPAYSTAALFNRFINGLRDNGIPSRIDRSVLGKMSGGEQSSLLATLRFLKLIEANGIPKSELAQLVETQGEEYKAVLAAVIKAAYDFLFDGSIEIAKATGQQVADKFRALDISGSTVTKSMTFFLGVAKDAGITISSHVKPPPAQKSANGAAKRKKPAGEEQSDSTSNSGGGAKTTSPPPPPPPTQGWHEQLLAKFPQFDPAWDDTIKAKWFEAFNDLMKRGQS
jgi:hypothetical protein